MTADQPAHLALDLILSMAATGRIGVSLDEAILDTYPNLGAMYQDALISGHSIDREFEFGLELILEGLERQRSA